MTLKIVLHGIKRHEFYYLNDIFMCRFTFVDSTYDITNDSHILMFFNISRESMNEIIATVDRQMDAFNYEYITEDEDLGFIVTTKYCVRKKEDNFYAARAKSYLNSHYGIQSGRYSTRKRRSKYDVKAIYKGVEHKTGKFKTVVIWNESSKEVALNKTTVSIDSPGNDIHAFAYAYVKREYCSNSAFKRHVDKNTIQFNRRLFFDDGEYQAQVSVLSNVLDIYDMAALMITFRDFGGAKNVIEIVEEKTYE